MGETKRQKVLEYLKRNPHGLTGLEMVTKFGCLNYKNDIFVLRSKGYPIVGEWQHKYDAQGRELERWMRYYIPAGAMK